MSSLSLPSMESMIDELETNGNLSYSVRDIPRGYICSLYIAWRVRSMRNVDPIVMRLCEDIFEFQDKGNKELFGLLDSLDELSEDDMFAQAGD